MLPNRSCCSGELIGVIIVFGLLSERLKFEGLEFKAGSLSTRILQTSLEGLCQGLVRTCHQHVLWMGSVQLSREAALRAKLLAFR